MPGGHTEGYEFPSIRQRKAAVLWWLHHNGDLLAPDGRATVRIMEAIASVASLPSEPRTFAGMLKDMEADGLISRLINGKRTEGVGLEITEDALRAGPYGKDPWNGHPAPTADDAAVDALLRGEAEATVALDGDTIALGPSHTTEALEAPVLPPDASEPDEGVNVPDRDAWTPPAIPEDADPYALLGNAMAFIAQAIASSRPVERTDPQVLQRLSETLEDNQRLRHRNSALADTVRALTEEAQALRRAKAALETNLQTVANGRLDEAALRRFRDLDRLIRTAPGTAKGD